MFYGAEETMTENTDIARIKIRFSITDLGEAEGELARFLAPRSIDAILRKLPFEGRTTLWKEEVYFEIPVKLGLEKPKSKVEEGTIAFWPIGSAFCIFFGQSQPYSPVTILGKITKNLELFKRIQNGNVIKVELFV